LVLSSIMNSISQLCQRAYAALISVADILRSPLLLVIRLYFFWQLLQIGLGKLTNIAKVAEYFGTLGIPFPALNARITCGVETFGSLLLIIGLATRPTALLVTIVMTVAYLTGDREAVLQIFGDPDKIVKAAPFPFFVMALVLFVAGPGWISIDAWLSRLFKAKAAKSD
jgi:putative oxidoreductase